MDLTILGIEQGKTLQTIATILDNRPVLQHTKPGVKHAPSSPDLVARLAEEALWKEAKDSWQEEMKKLDIASRLLPKKGRAGARAGWGGPFPRAARWDRQRPPVRTDQRPPRAADCPTRGRESAPTRRYGFSWTFLSLCMDLRYSETTQHGLQARRLN